jgi:hypothetical protein
MHFLSNSLEAKAGVSPPSLYSVQSKKIAKVAPAFHKMVRANEEGEWFKMQVTTMDSAVFHSDTP